MLRPELAIVMGAALALCACGETADEVRDDSPPAAAPMPPRADNAAPEHHAAVEEPARLTAEAMKGEKGARDVLLSWARALERQDFAEARALFRDEAGAPDYADRLAGFGTITVAAPVGKMEGAAGSLYYSSPATVTGTDGGGRRAKWQALVMLRRVNDVPGASPEQLRWHIESAELKPVI